MSIDYDPKKAAEKIDFKITTKSGSKQKRMKSSKKSYALITA